MMTGAVVAASVQLGSLTQMYPHPPYHVVFNNTLDAFQRRSGSHRVVVC